MALASKFCTAPKRAEPLLLSIPVYTRLAQSITTIKRGAECL